MPAVSSLEPANAGQLDAARKTFGTPDAGGVIFLDKELTTATSFAPNMDQGD